MRENGHYTFRRVVYITFGILHGPGHRLRASIYYSMEVAYINRSGGDTHYVCDAMYVVGGRRNVSHQKDAKIPIDSPGRRS